MRLKFALIVILQAALLVGMIGYRQHWVDTGQRVLLRTEPVDPRDLFRGDYVRLSYDISNLDLDALHFPGKTTPNQQIYVSLAADPDGTYRASAVGVEPPPQGRFIQGRVRHESQASRWEVRIKDDAGEIRQLRPRWFGGFNAGERLLFCMDKKGNALTQMREMPNYKPKCFSGDPLWATIEEMKQTKFRQLGVEYGIESYFVEEGKGRAIEAARNARDLKVEVSLRRDGKAIITGLMLDGTVLR